MVLDSVKDSVEKLRKRFMERPKLAFFVDGPNMIRKEFNLNLRDLRKRVEKYGRIVVGKVFLNQFASEKLIEAVANEGLEAVIALGDPELKTDVDVSIAVHTMEAVFDPAIEIIALATRDADFLPLIQKIKQMGKIAVLIAVKPGLAVSLKHAADHVELIK